VVGQLTAPNPPVLATLTGADHPGGREAACVVVVERPVGDEDCVVVVPDPLAVLPQADPSRATAIRIKPSLKATGARCDQLMGIFRTYFKQFDTQEPPPSEAPVDAVDAVDPVDALRSSRGSSGRRVAWPASARRRQAIPESASKTTLFARNAVTSAWS
jgi:hypothetical protein